MMRVACVMRSGGAYSLDWVWKLAAGLVRHTPAAQLVCLTDLVAEPCTERGVIIEPLPGPWGGWWSKMSLWGPHFYEPGLTLFLDLDTVIVGDVSPFFDYAGDLAMMRDFNLREHREVTGKPAIGSAVVVWRGDAMGPVYRAFVKDPAAAIRAHPRRMDHFIRRHLPPCEYVQDLWPGLIGSAKNRFAGWLPGPPAGAALLCTWGKPRIDQLPLTHWYRKLWEEQC
jgi:hypothetical protein